MEYVAEMDIEAGSFMSDGQEHGSHKVAFFFSSKTHGDMIVDEASRAIKRHILDGGYLASPIDGYVTARLRSLTSELGKIATDSDLSVRVSKAEISAHAERN